MVGGRRSQGCGFCRKRKIGCDLVKPRCGQCVDRGHACGDFQEFFKFALYVGPAPACQIKKTTTKKKRPSKKAAPKSTIPTAQPHSENALTRRDKEISPRPILPLSPSTRPFQVIGMIEAFSRVYALSSSDASHLRRMPLNGQPGRLLSASLSLTRSRNLPILERALAAMSLTGLGVQNQDRGLLMQGRKIYGEVLGAYANKLTNVFQRASSPRLRSSPGSRSGDGDNENDTIQECLMLGMVCCKTEFYGNASCSAAMDHAHGTLKLLSFAGHSVMRVDETYHALAESRIDGYGVDLLMRKGGIFGTQGWRYADWMPEDPAKQDQLQLLLDWGYEVPGIMERFDKCSKLDEVVGDEELGLETLAAVADFKRLHELDGILAGCLDPETRAGTLRPSRWAVHGAPAMFFQFQTHESAVTWMVMYMIRLVICREIIAMQEFLQTKDLLCSEMLADVTLYDRTQDALMWADCIFNCLEGFFEPGRGLLGMTQAWWPFAFTTYTYGQFGEVVGDRVLLNRMRFCRFLYAQYREAKIPVRITFLEEED